MAPFKQVRVLAHMKQPFGRPSEYKPEYCQAVIDCMAAGKSLTAFAGTIGMSRETIYEWMTVHADFADAVKRAKPARVNSLEDKLLSAEKGGQTVAAIFALKNADPMEWRDIRTTEHNHNINVAALTDEQLNAIASGAELGMLPAPMVDVTPNPAPRLSTDLCTEPKRPTRKRAKSKT